MDRKEVMEIFNRQPRVGALATSNSKGEVNVAVFGSPTMIDENTVVMGIGHNRSYDYLKENPNAAFIVMEPGKNPMEWKGVRVYLKAESMETEGSLLEEIKGKIEEKAGKGAAGMIKAAIRFKVIDARPLIAPA